MEQHEIKLCIKVANRKIREIQEQVLNDLAKDLHLNGRTLTYEDMETLKNVQVGGNILVEKIERYYNHFEAKEDVAPIADEEDDF